MDRIRACRRPVPRATNAGRAQGLLQTVPPDFFAVRRRVVGGRPGSFGTHQGGAPSISPIDIPSARSTIGTTRSAHSSMLRMALALS